MVGKGKVPLASRGGIGGLSDVSVGLAFILALTC